ncbi:DUF4190 domain-containing protein [Pseudokineococcus sp. 1T1Z-3]|uniref:DUF4190 domain-containing protein n=1 Tax=Pseudokineococcus sp. 1T1Z-3 TaxID=3132745 RepID=UPI003098C803
MSDDTPSPRYGQPGWQDPYATSSSQPGHGQPSPVTGYGGTSGATTVPATSMLATNSKAVVAISSCWAFPLLGLVFGIMARREIARTGEGGSGFAMTGIVVGAVFTGIIALYVVGVIAVVGLGIAGSGF